MPVTLNPPPFPTPDNNKVNAGDKAGDANAAPTDAFSALLTSANDAPVDAANAGTRPGIDNSGIVGKADQPFAAGALIRAGHKLPIIKLPIDGADSAVPARGIKPDAVLGAAAADKLDPDRKDSDDTATIAASGAADLAGMSAILSALLAPADRATELRSEAATADGKRDAQLGVGATLSDKAGDIAGGSASEKVSGIASEANASFAAALAQGSDAVKAGSSDSRGLAAAVANALDAGADAAKSATASAGATAVDASNRSADVRQARMLDADAARAETATALNANATLAAPATAALAASAFRDTAADTKAGANKSDRVDTASSVQGTSVFQHDVTLQRAESITIATPVTSPGWHGEFAEKLGQVIMTGSDRAEFRMHPANMGPVDVKITMNADQASIMITAPHATTRDALEQALPQLRDLLANQGITLGQANVQSEHRPTDQAPRARGASPTVDAPVVADMSVRTVRSIGLVDTFA